MLRFAQELAKSRQDVVGVNSDEVKQVWRKNFVMGGYSHLFPSGQFPRSILVSFVCTCITLCLCRALYLAARVTPALYLSLCCVCGAGGPIEFARKYCVRSRFLYISYLRASFVLENRSPANSAVRRWYSNRAVDY